MHKTEQNPTNTDNAINQIGPTNIPIMRIAKANKMASPDAHENTRSIFWWKTTSSFVLIACWWVISRLFDYIKMMFWIKTMFLDLKHKSSCMSTKWSFKSHSMFKLCPCHTFIQPRKVPLKPLKWRSLWIHYKVFNQNQDNQSPIYIYIRKV